MEDQLVELAGVARERSLTYSFLARMLSDDEVGCELLAALGAEPPQTGTELDSFAAGLAGADDGKLEAVRSELAADHASTLLGVSSHPVSPYESVHTSEKHLMKQQAWEQVVHAYAASGFVKAEQYHVPEDHISLELDFMAALGARAATAIEAVANGEPESNGKLEEAEKDLNAQLDFLEKHLLVWVPGLCDELEGHARTPFYRGIAQMLRVFMEQESAYLDELNAAEQS